MTKLLLAPAFAKICCELSCQFSDYLLAVLSPLSLQQFRIDSAANLPVELRKLGVDRAGNPLTGRINELAHIG